MVVGRRSSVVSDRKLRTYDRRLLTMVEVGKTPVEVVKNGSGQQKSPVAESRRYARLKTGD